MIRKRSAIHVRLLAETNSAMIDARGLAIEATTRRSIQGGQFQPLWITFACSHSQHDLKGHCWALAPTVDAIWVRPVSARCVKRVRRELEQFRVIGRIGKIQIHVLNSLAVQAGAHVSLSPDACVTRARDDVTLRPLRGRVQSNCMKPDIVTGNATCAAWVLSAAP